MTTPTARGFTLPELLATVAIIAILLSAAGPSLHGLLAKHRLAGAAEAVLNQLQYARSSALVHNRDIYVGFIPADPEAGTSWCVGVTDKSSCNCHTPDDCTVGGITRTAHGAAYPEVSLITNFGGHATGFSRPRAMAVDNGTAVLSHGPYSVSLIVANLGRVRPCATGLRYYPVCS